MPTVTRHSVFETNSSSSHSISIDPAMDFIPDRLPMGSDGIIDIYPGEFGWGVDYYYDAITKASYALTWCKMIASGDQDGVMNVRPGLATALPMEHMLKTVIKKMTGAKEVRFVPLYRRSWSTREGEENWGHIDHQSSPSENGPLGKCGKMFESEQNLRRFIFNTKSELLISNDNI